MVGRMNSVLVVDDLVEYKAEWFASGLRVASEGRAAVDAEARVGVKLN